MRSDLLLTHTCTPANVVSSYVTALGVISLSQVPYGAVIWSCRLSEYMIPVFEYVDEGDKLTLWRRIILGYYYYHLLNAWTMCGLATALVAMYFTCISHNPLFWINSHVYPAIAGYRIIEATGEISSIIGLQSWAYPWLASVSSSSRHNVAWRGKIFLLLVIHLDHHYDIVISELHNRNSKPAMLNFGCLYSE